MAVSLTAEQLAEFGQFMCETVRKEYAGTIEELKKELDRVKAIQVKMAAPSTTDAAPSESATPVTAISVTAVPEPEPEPVAAPPRVLSEASYAILGEFAAARNSDEVFRAEDVVLPPLAHHGFPIDLPVIYHEGPKPALDLAPAPEKIAALLSVLQGFPLQDHSLFVSGRSTLEMLVGRQPSLIGLNFVRTADATQVAASLEALRAHLRTKCPAGFKTYRFGSSLTFMSDHGMRVHVALTCFPSVERLVKRAWCCWDGQRFLLSAYAKLCLERRAHAPEVYPDGVSAWVLTAPVLGLDQIVPHLDMAQLEKSKEHFSLGGDAVVMRQCCSGYRHGTLTPSAGWSSIDLPSGVEGVVALLANKVLADSGRAQRSYYVVVPPGQSVDAVIPAPSLADATSYLVSLVAGHQSFDALRRIVGDGLTLRLLTAWCDQDTGAITAMVGTLVGECGGACLDGQGFLPFAASADAATSTQPAIAGPVRCANALVKNWYGKYYRDI